MHNSEGFQGSEPWRGGDNYTDDDVSQTQDSNRWIYPVPYAALGQLIKEWLHKKDRKKVLLSDTVIKDIDDAFRSAGGLPTISSINSIPISRDTSEKKSQLRKAGIIFSAAVLLTTVFDDANHGKIHDQIGIQIHQPKNILIEAKDGASKVGNNMWNQINPVP